MEGEPLNGSKGLAISHCEAAVHGSTLPFLFHKYIYYNTIYKEREGEVKAIRQTKSDHEVIRISCDLMGTSPSFLI